MTQRIYRQCPRCQVNRRVQEFYAGREICRTCISTANRERREQRAANKDGVSSLLARWPRVTVE